MVVAPNQYSPTTSAIQSSILPSSSKYSRNPPKAHDRGFSTGSWTPFASTCWSLSRASRDFCASRTGTGCCRNPLGWTPYAASRALDWGHPPEMEMPTLVQVGIHRPCSTRGLCLGESFSTESQPSKTLVVGYYFPSAFKSRKNPGQNFWL